MPDLALLLLAAVAVLMLKHTAADFFLQTPYQYLNKGTYGHPGGLLHSAIHVVLTPLVYLVLAPGSFLVAGAIALGEFLVHYHVDWAKEQVTHRNGLTSDCPGFWYALGTDQLMHGLTYIAIVAVLVWVVTS
ncbi:MAG: DUF3307 domain-containing protein [Methyloceanibacter sp.]